MSSAEDECKRIIGLKDYYEILGVPKTATEDEIRRAYKKLAIKFHPDKNKSPGAEEAFKQVNQAFSVLGNKEKKAHYDMYGTEEGMGMSGHYSNVDPFEIFNMFFQGAGFGPMGGGIPRRGRTRVTFSNGNGTFSFTSFGGGGDGDGDGDDDDDVFTQFFGFGPGIQFTNRRGNQRQQQQRRRNNNDNERRRQEREQMNKSLENAQLCLQLTPILCCLVFVLIPFLIRSII